MAKTVTRQTLIQFGSSGSSANFGQFGSQAAGSPVTTKSIPTMQSLAAWLNGLQSAVAAGNAPYLQDMNTLFYVLAYQQFYSLQEGVAEYDTGTTYFIGSLVKRTGTSEIYMSLIDTNLNQALPTAGSSNSNWQFVYGIISGSFRVGGPMAMNAQKITGIADGSAAQDAGSYRQIKVLQIVSATYQTEVSTSSASYADTGLTATITPSATTSKILILTTQNVRLRTVAQQDVSGSLRLIGTTNGTLISSVAVSNVTGTTTTGSTYQNVPVNWLDAPGTVSAQTYKIQSARTGGAGTFYTCDGNTTPSTIILAEINGL